MKKFIAYLLHLISNERGDSDSFRTMMVSLNMLLLAFFITLNSIAVIDDNHTKKALGSLIGSFRVLPWGVSPREEGGRMLGTPDAVPMVEIKSIAGFMEELESYSISEGFGQGFGMQTAGEMITMTLDNNILFEKNSTVLQKQTIPFLKQISTFFEMKDKVVQVRGHWDSSRPPKPYQSTWEYSAAKAYAVVKFFIEKNATSPKRFAVMAYGDSQPLYPNNSKTNRQKNRRIEIIFGEDL